MTKNVLKFAGGFLALLILGLGAFWVIQYYQYRKNPEQQALNEFEKIKKLYEEDTYGGSTPEETLALFIDALKKGDIELASRYFVIEEQGKWLEFLRETAASENYKEWLLNFSNARKVSSDEIGVTFEYKTKTTKDVSVEGTNIKIPPGTYKNSISLLKIHNGRWKLQEI